MLIFAMSFFGLQKSASWCCVILGFTLTGKIYSLIMGGALLLQPHPFLPGSYEFAITLGAIAEALALSILVLRGARAFLTASLGLSFIFICYHALEVKLSISGPCPCLGGLLGHWKPLAEFESLISFVLASALGISAFLGLFSPDTTIKKVGYCGMPTVSILCSVALWMLLGLITVWLWRGRTLGGDEGMEAAKSLQWLIRPGSHHQMWNDQPGLFSIFGEGLFRVFGPSLNAARIGVTLIGVLLPITWTLYWNRVGEAWVGFVATFLGWLILQRDLASFMLEAPAYALGTAALLPLMVGGNARLQLFLSACFAALALSIKFTAVFALIAPLVWLAQQNHRRCAIWCLLILVLVVLGSCVQPGWSWRLMRLSHIGLPADTAQQYKLDPAYYTQAWLICLLAVIALARGYVQNQMEQHSPWLMSAVGALIVHLLHHPFWSYYDLHLLAPLVVLAGKGTRDVWLVLREAIDQSSIRRMAYASAIMLCVLWVSERVTQAIDDHRTSIAIATSPITKKLEALGHSGYTAFSINPIWTFAAHLPQTPIDLTVIPLKRIWSGQLNESAITSMLSSNHVDAVVITEDLCGQQNWANFLAGYLPVAKDERYTLFVRRELNVESLLPDSNEHNDGQRILRQIGFKK